MKPFTLAVRAAGVEIECKFMRHLEERVEGITIYWEHSHLPHPLNTPRRTSPTGASLT